MNIKNPEPKFKSKGKINIKKWVKNIVFYGLGFVILAYIFNWIGIDDIYQVLLKTNFQIFGISIIVYGFAILMLIMRWQYLLKLKGYNAKYTDLLNLVLMGQFINNITPSMKGGGEPFRAYYLSKLEDIPYHVSFSTVMIERLLDSVVFLTLSLITILYFIVNGLSEQYTLMFIIAWIVVMALTGLILYAAMKKQIAYKIVKFVAKIIRKVSNKKISDTQLCRGVDEFQDTLIFFKTKKKGIAVATFYSFMWWSLDIFKIYIFFIAIGSIAPLFAVSSTYLVSLLVGIVPALPGGLGTSDTVMIAMYMFFNISPSSAATITLLDRAVSYVLVSLFGAISFQLIKSKSKKLKKLRKLNDKDNNDNNDNKDNKDNKDNNTN
ncbi:flippase-like domain-containing protein [Methanococcus voltae]|uniref:Lysylphosphatidylglycerol synthetase/UPF0104 n=1 Tax=Methanococcus voltae (strain ATCC BAA-1334 / A3) TaxID=456320 RepID=D7DUD9_METV3|nr:flippase-like domain-containing protein [Methanococcus voltae]MCS3900549.1 uncharacterized protein (TIRG00374 family) [Methanococcus voltae]